MDEMKPLNYYSHNAMAQTPPRLPSEVWNLVFRCLSTADKLSLRASCQYFNTLVDHGSLWKHWPVVLRFRTGCYNRRFWASLRRRRVTTAVVRSSRVKDWKQVAHFLPAATTLVMDASSQQSLHYVRDFPGLRRLAVRNSSTPLVLDSSTVCKPEQLTHLSLCDVTLPTATIEGLISAVSHFTNLTSLVCHGTVVLQETSLLVHSLLSWLPELKHLSLSVAHNYCSINAVPSLNPRGGGRAPALSSLELIDCMDHSVRKHAMKLMPGLKSLAVSYRYSQLEWPSTPPCHLDTWLSDLPQLSTLVILKGPAVENYVTSIPPTVTSLTLCVPEFSSKDLAATAAQVPDLLQLHIDPWPTHLGALTAQIPLLFPKLRHLKVRLEHVPEDKFLALHKLPDLEHLEVLDSLPHFSELIDKLRALTNYRVENHSITSELRAGRVRGEDGTEERILGFWSILVLSVVVGCICCVFSWTLTYLDSYQPGKGFLSPPSLALAHLRDEPGHRFQVGYGAVVLNGLMAMLTVFWILT